MNQPVRRDTARVILAGREGRVLLFRYCLPEPWAREAWLTPGGAIDPGETPAMAAIRELREETGYELAAAEIGAAVAYDSGQWRVDGILHTTVNWYYLAVVRTMDVDLSGQDPDEREALLDHRWWTLGDLRATDDLVFPLGLADLLPGLLSGERPAKPVRLPWS
jgi:8-oxo-dGTP pyrophosphatase MutT (NUDIX family)